MHGGGVQRIGRAADAQKAGALFEGFRAQSLDLLEFFAALERTVFVAPGHNRLRQRRPHARDALQQRGARRVEFHPHAVYAAHDHFVQLGGKERLVHVVLVLPHANRLRVDLHEFRQRILQAAADGNGAAHGQIEVRELLAGDFARRIHARPRLRDAHHDRDGDFRMLGVEFLQRGAAEGFRLASGRAVADGDRLGTVLVDDEGEGAGGFVGLLLGEDDGFAEIFAGFVHHGDLAAGADARVDGEDGLLAQGGGEEQVPEVLGEHVDGGAVGFHLLLDGDVDFAARGQEALVGVLRGEGDLGAVRFRPGARRVFGGKREDVLHDRTALELEMHPQDAFLLSAADGEVAVGGDCRQRLGKVVVLLEFGRLLGFFARRLALDDAFLGEGAAHESADFGVVRQAFGQDVARELQVFARAFEGRAVPDGVRQGFEAFFLRDLGAGAAFGLVGLVEVLERGLLVAGGYLRLQLVRQLALFVDGLEDGLLAGLEVGVVGQALLDLADLHFVEVAVRLLAVAGDEGDGAPVRQKFLDGGDLRGAHADFGHEAGLNLRFYHGRRKIKE